MSAVDPFAALSAEERAHLRPAPLPERVEPMKAVLAEQRFSNPAYEDGRLRYAGKVGTGFTRATLRDLGERLEPLRTDRSPFADEVRQPHSTWVEPRLVAQVGFSEWTRDGRLRHPRFLGLREDKAAGEVVRERAEPPRGAG